ncbi:hypothetical protein F5887DRAFT_64907 [Amanita rubescens]|nr:hypothetical protein F5887DRAFT_64907 [Amanita rubescens]
MLSDVEIGTISIVVQAVLSGVYFATFLLCLRWQIYSDDALAMRKNIKWCMVAVTIVIFAFSMVDLGISLRIRLLLLNGNEAPSEDVVSSIIEPLTMIITDGVLIYRCWVAHEKWWSIVGPPLLLLSYNFTSVIMITYWKCTGPTKMQAPIVHMYESFLGSTILIHIYATSAIIVQICRKSSMARLRFGGTFAIRVIAESGLLYTLTSIAVLCAMFTKYAYGPVCAMTITTVIVRFT